MQRTKKLSLVLDDFYCFGVGQGGLFREGNYPERRFNYCILDLDALLKFSIPNSNFNALFPRRP
jgi:hypothetical protein